jgi:branched-chain amino acid aminotransferase
MTPAVYFNGRFVPEAEARLSPQDAGFVQGATVVDNARTYAGKLFRWEQHLDRFFTDCRECGIPLNAPREHLTSVATELIRDLRSDVHVVTVATPGPPGGSPTLLMSTQPLRVERYREFFREGVSLSLAGRIEIPPESLFPVTAKHRSRMHWYRADQIVKSRSQPHAVPVIENRGAFDTAIGGIVAIRADGTLLLPHPELVQRSISVEVIADLASELQIPTTQAAFSWDSPDIIEVLLAGTGFGLAGVSTVSGEKLVREFTWPGTMCPRLSAAWTELVGRDIAEPFR